MPRRLRLLCAACLVEGMGLDWRIGRDWFAYALTDHDYAINECMWQNAGLCGVDPFYRGLQWEARAGKGNDEYVDASAGAGAAGAGATGAGAGKTPSTREAMEDEVEGEEEEDEDEEGEEEEGEGDSLGSNRYIRRWLDPPPLSIPPWPPALHAAAATPRE